MDFLCCPSLCAPHYEPQVSKDGNWDRTNPQKLPCATLQIGVARQLRHCMFVYLPDVTHNYSLPSLLCMLAAQSKSNQKHVMSTSMKLRVAACTDSCDAHVPSIHTSIHPCRYGHHRAVDASPPVDGIKGQRVSAASGSETRTSGTGRFGIYRKCSEQEASAWSLELVSENFRHGTLWHQELS